MNEPLAAREAPASYQVMLGSQRVRPGYKQTEVGVIPEDWEVAQLNEVSDKITVGFVGSMSHLFRREGVPLLRGQNVLPHKLDLTDTKFISSDTHKLWKKSSLRPRDVVMVRVGYPGTACVIPNNLGEANAASLVVVSPTTRKLDSDFLCYVVNSEFGRRQIDSYLVGGAQQVLNITTAAIFQLPLPTKTEQEAIAEALSDADALIESLEQLIAKKCHLKQGAMQELLTGKKRLPGFSGKWEVKHIGEFTDCTSGGTPSTLMPNYWNGQIRWMSSGELNLKNVCEVEGRITEEGLRNSSTKMIPPNCVLVGLAGQGKTRGTVAMNRVDLCTNQSIAAILPNAAFDSAYLYYNLDARYRELRELSTGDGGRGGLNLTIIRSLAVPFPKLPEQTAIATILSDMDIEIAILETKLTKTRSLKQGMMHNLLTGRIRLIDRQLKGAAGAC